MKAVFSPLKLARRAGRSVFYRALPRVYQTSLPKSGTHLLSSALDALGFRLGLHQPFRSPHPLLEYDCVALTSHARRIFNGEYIVEHLPWKQEAENALLHEKLKIIFMYRDPRAALVSYAHFGAHMNPTHPLFDYFNSLGNLDARVMAALEGVEGRHSRDGIGRCAWGDLCDAFSPWRKSQNAHSVSFESLIGEQGGGSRERQAEALKGLIRYLGLHEKVSDFDALADRIFNRSSLTFRAGKINGWREEIQPDTLHHVNEKLKPQLAEWGYE